MAKSREYLIKIRLEFLNGLAVGSIIAGTIGTYIAVLPSHAVVGEVEAITDWSLVVVVGGTSVVFGAAAHFMAGFMALSAGDT